MPPIHRLLCTHCTFGTSELEANTPENAGKILGYSVRKSSLSEAERGQLRQLFRAVERLLSYSLPKDATAAHKEELSADSAPTRLIFVPNLGGWQVAGQVSYRSHDTAGRPGSYFADLIVERAADPRNRDAASPWSPVEILRLWARAWDRKLCPDADWWISSEEQLLALESNGPWKPSSLTTIASLRKDGDPLIDDAMLHRFLTAEPAGGEASGDPLVPERWWRMAAADRRRFVESVLHAVMLGPARGSRETVTIAAEPSVAALVFYAVCRLMPAPIAAMVSFSTYEPSPERPLTGLVATTFIDEENLSADLPQELYQRGFACNTFRDLSRCGRVQATPEDGYALHVVGLAAAEEWRALDDFLGALAATEGLAATNLDALTRLDHVIGAYLEGRPTGQLDVRPRSIEERFRRKRFRAAIETAADSRAEWPADLLRTAIAWLGDDLPALWETSKPLHDVLEHCLPVDGEPLGRLLTAQPPTPRCVLSEAVVAAARHATPPAMPKAFALYCRHVCSGANPRRDEAVRLVGEIAHMLPDAERGTILLTASSLEFADLLLDAVQNLDAAVCDRLGLPLAEMLHLVIGRALAKSSGLQEVRGQLAEFLDRHADVADRVSGSHDGMSAALRDLFTQLVAPDDGSQLAAERRSRVPRLRKWLRYLGPGTEVGGKFDHWEKLHKAAIDVSDQAKEAGSRFGRGLRRIPPETRGPLGQALSAVEALKPLEERVGDDRSRSVCREARKKLVRGTFSALGLPTDANAPPLKWVLEEIDAGLDATDRDQEPWQGPRRRTFAIGVASALLVVLAVAAVTVTKMYWPHDAGPPPPQAKAPPTANSESGSPPAADETSTPPPSVTRPVSKGGPTKGAEEDKLATIATIKPQATEKGAAIVVTWKPQKGIENTPCIEVTYPQGTPQRIPIEPEKGTLTVSTKGRGYGVYTIAWQATASAQKELLESFQFLKPEGVFTTPIGIGVDVQEDRLSLGISLGVLPKPERYGAPLRYELIKLPRGKGSREQHVAESAWRDGSPLRFDLDKSLCTPESLSASKFRLRLHAEQGSVDGGEFNVPAPPFKESLDRNLQAHAIPAVDRHYACELPMLGSGEFTELFEIPWSFCAWDTLQLSILDPTTPADSAQTLMLVPAERAKDKPCRWHCKTRDNKSVGHFEVITSDEDPWRKPLRFSRATGGDQRGYDRLRASQVQITADGGQWFLQFLRPTPLGPIDLAFALDDNGKADAKDDRWTGVFFSSIAQLRPLLEDEHADDRKSLLDKHRESLVLVSGTCDLPEGMRLEFINDDKATTSVKISFRGAPIAQSQVVFKPDAQIEVTKPRLLKKNQKGDFYADHNLLQSTKNLREKATTEKEEIKRLEEDRQREDEVVKKLTRLTESLEKKSEKEQREAGLSEKQKELIQARQSLGRIVESIERFRSPSVEQLNCIDALANAKASTPHWNISLQVVGRDAEGKPSKDSAGRVICFFGSDDTKLEAVKFESLRPGTQVERK